MDSSGLRLVALAERRLGAAERRAGARARPGDRPARVRDHPHGGPPDVRGLAPSALRRRGGGMMIDVELPSTPSAPARARGALDQLGDRISAERMRDVRLLVSELVTNAVRHAGGEAVRLVVALKGAHACGSRSTTPAAASSSRRRRTTRCARRAGASCWSRSWRTAGASTTARARGCGSRWTRSPTGSWPSTSPSSRSSSSCCSWSRSTPRTSSCPPRASLTAARLASSAAMRSGTLAGSGASGCTAISSPEAFFSISSSTFSRYSSW